MIIRISNKFVLAIYILLIVATVSTFRNRGVESEGMDLQLIIKAFVWLFCGAISLFFALRINLRPMSLPQWMILIYAALILIQSPTSPAGSYSIMASLVFCIFVLTSIVMFRLFDYQQATNAFLLASLGICILSLIFYVAIPSIALQEYWNDMGYIEGVRFKGIGSNANAIGQVSALSLFLLLVVKGHGRPERIKYVLFTAILAVLLLSQSRTSMLALILATSYYFLHRRYASIVYLLFIGLTLATTIWATEIYLKILPSLTRSGGLEELFTFTGRTMIWEVVTELIAEKPWLGYGYAASKQLLPLHFETSWGWTTVNSHQFILQLLLSSGVIGSLPVFIILAIQVYFLVTFKSKLASSLFIFILVTGALESGAIGPIPNYLTLLWLVTISMLFKEYEREKSTTVLNVRGSCTTILQRS
ncbi:O-antigen ligase family protein [Vibrio bivalvicida]|uniref:O-antigen ligase family protein n=1 Tax=Vibrio bivalvicida TaxID=1276888 RepID=A0ABV4MMH7_9VIBR